MGKHVRAGDLDTWIEQVGQGPGCPAHRGAGDTVESWQFQLDGLADRYRLTAFDNRGAGRTAMPGGSASVEMMADDGRGPPGARRCLRPRRGLLGAGASPPRSWRSATRSSFAACPAEHVAGA
jgi:pimeloyl-ACP methyl ester carboxylesterase